MKTKKQTAYQKATDRMEREVKRAINNVETLNRLYAEMVKEKKSQISS